MKLLNSTGLTELWARCKAFFAPKDHVHTEYLPLSGGKMTGSVELAGATTTGEIVINGGDAVGAGKIALGASGQITDTSTATLLGRSEGNVLIGSTSYPTLLRGKNTRPTYNGNEIALKSDIQSAGAMTYGQLSGKRS